jgi:hypothetical protein
LKQTKDTDEVSNLVFLFSFFWSFKLLFCVVLLSFENWTCNDRQSQSYVDVIGVADELARRDDAEHWPHRRRARWLGGHAVRDQAEDEQRLRSAAVTARFSRRNRSAVVASSPAIYRSLCRAAVDDEPRELCPVRIYTYTRPAGVVWGAALCIACPCMCQTRDAARSNTKLDLAYARTILTPIRQKSTSYVTGQTARSESMVSKGVHVTVQQKD